jgi:flagellin
MARINTNVAGLVAQRHLTQSYTDLGRTIQRLSSGLRITRGADDPAGLIVSERLRSEIGAVRQAVTNTQRASNIIATTEGALDEVARLLRDIQARIIESANSGALSDDEIRANQLQVDSAIASITRIANSTTFAGRKLLNGSLGYITSGVSDSIITGLAIHGVQFGTQQYIPVNVDVIQSAQHARLFYTQPSLSAAVAIEIAGDVGVTTLNFASGSTATQIIQAINLVSDATGVSAALVNPSVPASGVVLSSTGLGSKEFVSVQVLPGGGSFVTYDALGGSPVERDTGRDASALINGALALADGNELALKTSVLDIELRLADNFGKGLTSFAITSGGALFQVGPQVTSDLQVNVGVGSVSASRLGNATIGFLSQVQSDGPYSLIMGKGLQAQEIVKESIKQVAVLRGRLGAFEKNTLDTNANQLSITLENLAASESTIRDADFADETSQLSRAQILVAAGTSVLALAQQTPQSVLQLLG